MFEKSISKLWKISLNQKRVVIKTLQHEQLKWEINNFLFQSVFKRFWCDEKKYHFPGRNYDGFSVFN